MKLSSHTIYTIANRDWIAETLQRGSGTRREQKRWVTGLTFFRQAKAAGESIPILIADSAENCWRLLAWGILDAVKVDETGTTYSVSRLRPFDQERTTQELVLVDSGRPPAPGFRRPYAICQTPGFLVAPEPSVVWMFLAAGEEWDGAPAAALADNLSAWEETEWIASSAKKVLRSSEGLGPRHGDPFFIFGAKQWLNDKAGVIARGAVIDCSLTDAPIVPTALTFSFSLDKKATQPWLQSPAFAEEVASIHEQAHATCARWWQKANLWPFEGIYAQQLISLLFEEPAEIDDSAFEHDHCPLTLNAEGRRHLVVHYQVERSKTNRKLVLEYFRRHGSLNCMACKFNFEEQFGPEFADLIEIHHQIPVSKEERIPNPKDFAVLCPNCHRMAHWGRAEPRTLDELAAIIRRAGPANAPRRRLAR